MVNRTGSVDIGLVNPSTGVAGTTLINGTPAGILLSGAELIGEVLIANCAGSTEVVEDHEPDAVVLSLVTGLNEVEG